MVTSHPALRSIVDGVTTAEDIDDMIGGALIYQYMFDKRTSPWEMAEWEEQELEELVLDAKDIDRHYHISHYDDGVSGRDFELVARLDYNGRSVYVQLIAGCDFTGFDCQGGGEIYLSFDAQVFVKSIISKDSNPHAIWKSMIEDGLLVEEPSDFDLLPVRSWHTVPMLKFLCHMSVYNEHDKLQHYEDILPRPIVASVEEFMRIRQTRDHYDNGD